ncbi:MAG: L-aspartate oxidase [Planctomycetota bacterium]|nr:L-aspartate oxidase [Planctomycetota bacterium]
MNEQYLLDLDMRRIPSLAPDVVVIGSGITAISAALAAAENASVLLVTKSSLKESNTFYAQGGVAAALAPGDSPENHLKDTLVAGAGLCDEDSVRKLVTLGPARVKELIDWGTPFDRESKEKLAFTLEGGHGHRRILHANGDATGQAIETRLAQMIHEHPNISVLENHFAVDLLHMDGVCYGMIALDVKGGRFLKIEAKATVLATGGLGQVYRETTNPDVTTGDGMAAAFRAGATVQDMEFVQFHPTVLYLAGAKRFLVSEAVRGEGAHLLNQKGERFMTRYDERGDLAPRDVVSRAIYSEMRSTGATNVYLSLAHLSPKMIQERFPTILKTLRQYGLDLTKDKIPVRPACHYMMGGVRTDLEARTDVQRLFAAGEVASCGIHGANRLASNSLLDGLVFGHEAGRQALKLAECSQPTFPDKRVRPMRNKETIPLDVDDVRASLKSLVSRSAGILRDLETMTNALQMLDFWQNYVYAEEFQSVKGLELQNMLACAQLIVRGALKREESRGAHQRSDFPNTDDANWKKHVTFKRSEFERGA